MDTLSFELTKWPKVPIPVTYLSTLYNDRSTSDFTIVLPRSQREIYVHKLILGSASGFFRGLFHSGMSDASDSSYTFQVEDHELSLDPDLAERAFGYVIQMLYTASFSCLRGEGDNDETKQENKDELQDSSAGATIENQAEEAISKDLKVVFQMLFISNFLQIKDLISACSFVLSRSISEANCFYYFMLPPTEEMFELKRRAVEFFAENKRRSLLDTNLSHLSYEVLVGLLVSKPMRLSEEETSILFDFWKAGDVESRESLREQFMNDIKEPSIESLSWYESKLKDITEEPFGVFEALKYIKRESRVLCIGLDAGGKTTLLYRLKLGECVTTIPTIGFNVETIEHSNNNITVWDVGGGDKIRPLWRHYFSNCNAIIVVVDSNDRERLSELKEAIDNYILGDNETSGLPILFWANKQDLPNALPVSELTERLGLHSITQRPWYIQACCAITADGLEEGLDWLVSAM